jgi:hypothetical protein
MISNTVVILDFLPAFHLTLAVEHSQTTASTLKPRATFILTLKIFMFTSIPHPKVSTETNVNKEIALIHPEKVKTLCRNWKHRSTLFMTHLYFIHLKGILFRIVTNLEHDKIYQHLNPSRDQVEIRKKAT